MKIMSPEFKEGEKIPKEYTRDGEDKSPPLHIEEVPEQAKSLALIMDDPRADASKNLSEEKAQLCHFGTCTFGKCV